MNPQVPSAALGGRIFHSGPQKTRSSAQDDNSRSAARTPVNPYDILTLVILSEERPQADRSRRTCGYTVERSVKPFHHPGRLWTFRFP